MSFCNLNFVYKGINFRHDARISLLILTPFAALKLRGTWTQCLDYTHNFYKFLPLNVVFVRFNILVIVLSCDKEKILFYSYVTLMINGLSKHVRCIHLVISKDTQVMYLKPHTVFIKVFKHSSKCPWWMRWFLIGSCLHN